jgi:hypothetical protein
VGLRNDTYLTAPPTDIFVSAVTWEVWLPEKRFLYRSTGDLEPLHRGPAMREARRVLEELPQPATATRNEKLHRIREGIERFFITDINSPAASAGAGAPRYVGPPLPANQAGPSHATSSIAGVLPVAISLPKTGVPHVFTKVLAPQGKPLALTLATCPQRVLTAARYTAFGIALLGGLALARAVLARYQRAGSALVYLVVFAVCLAAVAAAVWTFELSPVTGGMYALAGCFVALAFGRPRRLTTA